MAGTSSVVSSNNNNNKQLKIVSFNMNAYNQGRVAVDELIERCRPDVILLQEHWLTPANLHKLDVFNQYFTFGCSAMSHLVESGVLFGRPYGGAAVLVSDALRQFTRTIHCAERYAIIMIENLLLVSVYFPCVGTANRFNLCLDLVADIGSWLDQYPSCEYVIAGDFNVNLKCWRCGRRSN